MSSACKHPGVSTKTTTADAGTETTGTGGKTAAGSGTGVATTETGITRGKVAISFSRFFSGYRWAILFIFSNQFNECKE